MTHQVECSPPSCHMSDWTIHPSSYCGEIPIGKNNIPSFRRWFGFLLRLAWWLVTSPLHSMEPFINDFCNSSAMAAITYVVLFFCNVDPLTLMLPALLLGKIYSNSFLLGLNSRMSIAQGRVHPTGMSETAPYPGSTEYPGSMAGSVVFGV
jgi:hypothetical protein